MGNKEKVQALLSQLDDALNLTRWEEEFCHDLEWKVKKGYTISDRQVQVLQRIADERC